MCGNESKERPKKTPAIFMQSDLLQDMIRYESDLEAG